MKKVFFTILLFVILILPLQSEAGSVKIGDACTDATSCVTGAYCDLAETPAHTCKALKAEKIGCKNGYECLSTQCLQELCAPATTTPAVTTPPTTAAPTTTQNNILKAPKLKALGEICNLKDIQSKPGESASIPWIGNCFIGLYNYSLVLGAMFAVIFLIIGGVMITLAGINKNYATTGKQIMTGSITGLVILVLAFLILGTINPALLETGMIDIEPIASAYVSEEERTDYADTEPTTQALTGAPKKLTNSKEELMKICNTPEKDWPKTSPGMSSPDNTVAGFSAPGIKTSSNGILIDKSLIGPLTKLGQAAQSYAGGPYSILITSGYRPLAAQIKIACAHKADNFAKIGAAYAWPGGSIHGIGRAVDIRLMKGKNFLTSTSSMEAQFQTTYMEGIKILSSIAYTTGWQRYTKEIWHFEYQSGITTCRTSTCLRASRDCLCN